MQNVENHAFSPSVTLTISNITKWTFGHPWPNSYSILYTKEWEIQGDFYNFYLHTSITDLFYLKLFDDVVCR